MGLRLIFLGPQGSGKGTQASRLARLMGVPHISTGEMLRQAVAEGTELGQRADAIMQAGLFFIAGAAIYLYKARFVEEWASLRDGSRWMTGALIILAMSMIGIPPTGGFFGKWNIILSAMETQNFLAVGAVIIATLLTMAYFQRLFVSIFRTRETESDVPRIETPAALRFSIGLTSAAIIVLGLCSDPIVSFFKDTSASVGL